MVAQDSAVYTALYTVIYTSHECFPLKMFPRLLIFRSHCRETVAYPIGGQPSSPMVANHDENSDVHLV